MSGDAGKVALVTDATTLTLRRPTATPRPRVRDLVGYGDANFFEGAAAAPALSNTTAALRIGGGTVDTDNNDADFTAGAPNPRNDGPSAGADAAPTVARPTRRTTPTTSRSTRTSRSRSASR